MKSNHISAFYWVTWTLFMVTTLLGLANSHLDRKISLLGIETIAPANLEHSHEILESRLRVEKPDFPVDQLMATAAYREHVSKLAAYTEKLEIYRSNEWKRTIGLSIVSLVSAFAMLIFSILGKRRREEKA